MFRVYGLGHMWDTNMRIYIYMCVYINICEQCPKP